MEKDDSLNFGRLAVNNDYYNNVFKKTEKTISVVYYILSFIERNERTTTHLNYINDKALKAYELALDSLSYYPYEVKEKVFPLQQGLVALMGSLKLGNAGGVITDEVFALLASEIDLAQRYLKNHFLSSTPVSLGENLKFLAGPVPKKTNVSGGEGRRIRQASRSNIPAGDISTDAHLVYSQLVDRATRIKTVLEAKPEATIKDIAEVITDVSEKTIQRELNSLIEKGQVLRQGERRWSKYSIRQ